MGSPIINARTIVAKEPIKQSADFRKRKKSRCVQMQGGEVALLL